MVKDKDIIQIKDRARSCEESTTRGQKKFTSRIEIRIANIESNVAKIDSRLYNLKTTSQILNEKKRKMLVQMEKLKYA